MVGSETLVDEGKKVQCHTHGSIWSWSAYHPL